jgi:type II secretory pathway pseudopilin PulG
LIIFRIDDCDRQKGRSLMSAELNFSARQVTRPHGKAGRTQRGFSLIQMVFVLAIIMIAAAIAIPSFVRVAHPMRLRNDANNLANMIVMARMRASVEFAHVELYCTPTATSTTLANCQLKSYAYLGPGSWQPDPPPPSPPYTVNLSSGVIFAIPPSITTPVANQPTAYQGDAAQYTPLATTNTTNPVIVFNSRGLPVDPTNGTQPKGDYALYLEDTSTGAYYAVAVNFTGRPDLYQWDSTTKSFNLLTNGGSNGGI